MKILVKSFAILLLFIFQSCTAPAQKQDGSVAPIEVEVSEAAELIASDEVLLLDVRTPGEVNQGYIEGAKNINISDFEDFEAEVAQLDKNEPVMVYCKVGGRSHNAAVYLVEQGFAKIYDIKGGILAWEDAGEPLKKD